MGCLDAAELDGLQGHACASARLPELLGSDDMGSIQIQPFQRDMALKLGKQPAKLGSLPPSLS
jgi:hypothetical protein